MPVIEVTHFMILKFPSTFSYISVLSNCALIYLSIPFDISNAVLMHLYIYFRASLSNTFPLFMFFKKFIYVFSDRLKIYKNNLMFITCILLPINALGKKSSISHCSIG